MKHFKVLRKWDDVNFTEILQLMDIVGLWHYSKTHNAQSYYKITKTSSELTIESTYTNTVMKFDGCWRARVWHIDDNGRAKDKRMIEGTLDFCYDYMDKLIDLKIIEYVHA